MIFCQMQSLMPELKISSLPENSNFGVKKHHGYLNVLATVIERVQHQIRMMPGESNSSQHIALGVTHSPCYVFKVITA